MCSALFQAKQHNLGATDDGFRGQLGTKWSVLAQAKQGCLTFVASANNHVAMSSGSVTDQHIDEFAAGFMWN